MGAELDNAKVASTYLEKVRPATGPMFERDDTWWTLIEKNGEQIEVTPRAMRINHFVRPGGRGHYFDPNGGDMGSVSGSTRIESLVTPIPMSYGVGVNTIVEWATDSSAKAIEKVAKTEVKNAMKQFRTFIDMNLQGDGTGVLGSITSTNGASTTWTLATPQFCYNVYDNQRVSVYDSTITNKKGEATIDKIDLDAMQITVDANPTGFGGVVAGDVLLPEGLSGANPEWYHGIKYHHNGSAAGTWQNLSRAQWPQIRTPKVTASSALTLGHGRLVKNKILKKLGVESLNGTKIIAYMNLEQVHAVEQIALTISQTDRGSGGGSAPDLLYASVDRFAGCKIVPSIHADPTRIDFIVLDFWKRGVTKEVDMHSVGGQTVFTGYAATGNLKAQYVFYYVTDMQVANLKPSMGGYIETLNMPSGYSSSGT